MDATIGLVQQSQDAQDESVQLTAPPSTTGSQQLISDQAHVPELVSITPHTSPRHSFREGVCADAQSLDNAAVVNNIHVPPPRVPSSTISRQVSAVCVKHPIVPSHIVLNPRAPSFQPHVAQLGSTSSVPQGPTVSLSTVADPLSTTDSVFQSTTFTPSTHLFVPYTHQEPDEPKLPDIVHSKPDTCAPVLSAVIDVPVAGSDPEVPEHLQELFDKTVERSKLSSANQHYLAEVLRRNSDAILHDIETGDAKPIKQPPRRPPLAARDEEDKQLDEMLEPSYLPWSSPVCMAKKKDGSFRFCIDYRRINVVTEKDAYPVPHVKYALDSFYSAKYFATIDLLSGYWQIGMTERAKQCSAFCEVCSSGRGCLLAFPTHRPLFAVLWRTSSTTRCTTSVFVISMISTSTRLHRSNSLIILTEYSPSDVGTDSKPSRRSVFSSRAPSSFSDTWFQRTESNRQGGKD